MCEWCELFDVYPHVLSDVQILYCLMQTAVLYDMHADSSTVQYVNSHRKCVLSDAVATVEKIINMIKANVQGQDVYDLRKKSCKFACIYELKMATYVKMLKIYKM